MACDSERHLITEDDGLESLGVDSGILAIVDASLSDRFLAENEEWYDGSLPPFGPDGVRTPDGILLDAGGADIFPCEVEACGFHAHAFWASLDEPTPAARWELIGQVRVPSGVLLIGDPGLLEEYVPDPVIGPVEAHGVWTELAIRGSRVDVHVLREPAPADQRNQVIRVTDVPYLSPRRQGGWSQSVAHGLELDEVLFADRQGRHGPEGVGQG